MTKSPLERGREIEAEIDSEFSFANELEFIVKAVGCRKQPIWLLELVRATKAELKTTVLYESEEAK